MAEQANASKRYLELVDELAERLGRQRGWKSEVARRLGVHPSFVSRIADGQVQNISVDLIERAMQRLALPRSYFFGEDDDEPRTAVPVSGDIPSIGYVFSGQSAASPSDASFRVRARELRARAFAAMAAQNDIDPQLTDELADLVLRTEAVQAALSLRNAQGPSDRRVAALRLFSAIDAWL